MVFALSQIEEACLFQDFTVKIPLLVNSRITFNNLNLFRLFIVELIIAIFQS